MLAPLLNDLRLRPRTRDDLVDRRQVDNYPAAIEDPALQQQIDTLERQAPDAVTLLNTSPVKTGLDVSTSDPLAK